MPGPVRRRARDDRAVPQPAGAVARPAAWSAAAPPPSASRWPIINDARAFTLAEARIGAAAGCSTVVCLVLGTGIGGGVVVDGALHFGPHGRAGEIGPPGRGARRAALWLRQPRLPRGRRRVRRPLAGWPGSRTVEDVFARRGDRRRTGGGGHRDRRRSPRARHRQHGHVLVPERVVIGGGVAAAGACCWSRSARPSAATRPRADRLVRDRPGRARPVRRRHRRRPLGFRFLDLNYGGGCGGGGSAGAPRPAIDPAWPVDRQQAGCRRRRRFELSFATSGCEAKSGCEANA